MEDRIGVQKMKQILYILTFMSIILVTACGTANEKQTTNQNEETNAEKEITETNGYRQLTNDSGNNEYPTVEMVTSKGSVIVELYPDIAPKAVENFITHSKNGYYDGTTFHRVINEFMIQGGDPLGDGTGGESAFGAPFENEISDQVFHFKGALSMANAGPNTNGSQFFIVQKSTIEVELMQQIANAGYPEEILKAYEERGGTPWLDPAHTVFGQVIAGLEVVDQIASVEVDGQAKPTEPIIIEKMIVND
jgi:peptidyl-prolyl cis-trans isomerase B (cyclophilin B)